MASTATKMALGIVGGVSAFAALSCNRANSHDPVATGFKDLVAVHNKLSAHFGSAAIERAKKTDDAFTEPGTYSEGDTMGVNAVGNLNEEFNAAVSGKIYSVKISLNSASEAADIYSKTTSVPQPGDNEWPRSRSVQENNFLKSINAGWVGDSTSPYDWKLISNSFVKVYDIKSVSGETLPVAVKFSNDEANKTFSTMTDPSKRAFAKEVNFAFDGHYDRLGNLFPQLDGQYKDMLNFEVHSMRTSGRPLNKDSIVFVIDKNDKAAISASYRVDKKDMTVDEFENHSLNRDLLPK